MSFEVHIAGVPLGHAVYNAAGPLDVTAEELAVLGASGSSAIMMKSCTYEKRDGNPRPRWAHVPPFGLQAMGLPNLGYSFYVDIAPKLKKEHGKPVIASVSGLCTKDNIKIIEAFQACGGVDLIELNVSCPNIAGKPQVGYDFVQMRDVLEKLRAMGGDIPIGLKLPPYLDRVHVSAVADMLAEFSIPFISCINSIGNCLIIDPHTDRPVIKAVHGLGGLSGPAIKPVALGNVRMFFEELKSRGASTQIVGVGGIETGRDALDFILAGSTAVQVGTMFVSEGPAAFTRIADELAALLAERGFSSVAEACGSMQRMERQPDDSAAENM